jgi:hypothetical protein
MNGGLSVGDDRKVHDSQSNATQCFSIGVFFFGRRFLFDKAPKEFGQNFDNAGQYFATVFIVFVLFTNEGLYGMPDIEHALKAFGGDFLSQDTAGCHITTRHELDHNTTRQCLPKMRKRVGLHHFSRSVMVIEIFGLFFHS